jgi:hypothetical protein
MSTTIFCSTVAVGAVARTLVAGAGGTVDGGGTAVDVEKDVIAAAAAILAVVVT